MPKKLNPFLITLTLLSIVALTLLTIDYLSKNTVDLFSGASGSAMPQHVFISDIQLDGATVNWYTTRPATTQVKVINGEKEVDSFFDTEESYYHRIRLTHLSPSAEYKVIIVSNGEQYDLPALVFKTSPVQNSSPSFPVYGQVFDSTTTGYLQEGLIALQLDNGSKSQVYSAYINIVGGYQFNLQDLKNEDLDRIFDRNKPGIAYITVYNADKGEIRKTIPYDFSKSRQFVNLFADEQSIEQIPGVSGQL